MQTKYKQIRFLFFTLLLIISQTTLAKINIVAAENFYGDIAQTLGGDYVTVTSILNNPQQDPHLFSTSPSVAKNVAHADIVIYNGKHYEDWMPRLLSVPGKKKHREIIVVADLTNTQANDNPHIWYDPNTMWLYAQKLTAILIALDPDHKADYLLQLSALEKKQQAFMAYLTKIKPRLKGQPVAATEPVFNYMADALGLSMQAKAFQWSVENDGTPSPSAMREMLAAIQQRKIRALIYNQQVSDPMMTNLIETAKQHDVPVIAVTETQPKGMDYYTWMRTQLEALVAANS
ncbi:MAG: periplasmic solute binding family protein [Gammaproteobacteria bacterium]|jgi:zinc/manganese transport system substrate-binding protein|nr:periplasmic solute binding family protein [Gammaproteobacteria bacterium]